MSCRRDEVAFGLVELTHGLFGRTLFRRITSYNVCYTKLLRMLVGGLRSCGVMLKLLRQGDADLFALSRPLIREPDLPRTWHNDGGHIAVITSYSIHYTKLYDSGNAMPVPSASGMRHCAAGLRQVR